MAEGHTHHTAPYFIVFLALCVCTAASWIADELKQDSIGLFENKAFVIVVVLAIATAKALFVMAYFMHLKFEGRWKYVLLAPTIILACGIPLALLPDIGVHYYTDVAPQYVERAEASSSPDATDDAPSEESH